MCLCFRRWHRLYRSDGLCTKTFIPRVEKKDRLSRILWEHRVFYIFFFSLAVSSFFWCPDHMILPRFWNIFCCFVFDEISRSSEPATMFTCFGFLLSNHTSSWVGEQWSLIVWSVSFVNMFSVVLSHVGRKQFRLSANHDRESAEFWD